jgi:hypothetical protein
VGARVGRAVGWSDCWHSVALTRMNPFKQAHVYAFVPASSAGTQYVDAVLQLCVPSEQWCCVGVRVGAATGAAVGSQVGLVVGARVGRAVGNAVGCGVGTACR